MQVKLLQVKLICGLFIVLCGSQAHADYDAAALNKLFTDKNQRARIDAVRSGNSSGTEARQTSKVHVSGYVTRSNGKDVVWVNNQNTLNTSKVGSVKVQESNIGKNKKVGVTLNGSHVHLKPGEVWHKETGKIVDHH